MRRICLGLTAILLLASAASAEPSPEGLAQAQRLVRDFGGFANIVDSGVQTGLNLPTIVKSPGLFRQAYQKALADNAALIAQMDEKMTILYAQSFTTEELKASLDYYESPAGKSRMEKLLTAGRSFLTGAFVPPAYTQEEVDAQKAYAESPLGKSAAIKGGLVMGQFLATLGPALQKINSDAMADYCGSGADCSNIKLLPREEK